MYSIVWYTSIILYTIPYYKGTYNYTHIYTYIYIWIYVYTYTYSMVYYILFSMVLFTSISVYYFKLVYCRNTWSNFLIELPANHTNSYMINTWSTYPENTFITLWTNIQIYSYNSTIT